MDRSYTFNNRNNPHDELATIEEVIRANIEWAVRGKDTGLAYSTIVNNDELFFFQPDSKSTMLGFDQVREMTDQFFMRDDFKAIKVEINDFRISMSPSLRTAWWACILNDYNEFQGKPANWEKVRWTGVLEKMEGNWRIFQMHFSKAEDLVIKEYEDSKAQSNGMSESHGVFSLNELITTDLASAKEFYGELFGWNFKETKTINGNPYLEVRSEGTMVGGMMLKDGNVPDDVIPCWDPYITVDDVEESAKKVEELGGEVILPPTDIPKVGRFCVIKDPQGISLNLIMYKGNG